MDSFETDCDHPAIQFFVGEPHSAVADRPVVREVDDGDPPGRVESRTQVIQVGLPIFDMVQCIAQKDEIDAFGEVGIVSRTQNGLEIVDALASGGSFDVLQKLRIDVYGVDLSSSADRSSQWPREQPCSRSDVRYLVPRFDIES